MRSQENLRHRKSLSFKMSQWVFFPQLYARIPEILLLLKVQLENLFYIHHGMLCQVSHNCAVFKKLDFERIKYMKLTVEEIC